jgi:hypothetical protein
VTNVLTATPATHNVLSETTEVDETLTAHTIGGDDGIPTFVPFFLGDGQGIHTLTAVPI